MMLGLRSAIYPVKDLTAARDWYAALLGVGPYFDQPFYVGFSVGGFELGLIPAGDGADDGGQPSVAGVRAYWGVADAATAFDRLLSAGATALQPVTDVGDGIRVGSVVDPFGNALSIIQNPHFDPAKIK